MPDISMCPDETCPKARECYRNPLSGTKPTPLYQCWFEIKWDNGCRYFWPTDRAKTTEPKP